MKPIESFWIHPEVSDEVFGVQEQQEGRGYADWGVEVGVIALTYPHYLCGNSLYFKKDSDIYCINRTLNNWGVPSLISDTLIIRRVVPLLHNNIPPSELIDIVYNGSRMS